MTYRIVTADESDLMLLGIRTLLAKRQDCAIVGEVTSLCDLLKLLPTAQPHIVLYSDTFVGSEPLGISEDIAAVAPDAKRIVIGALAEGMIIHDLFALGVNGYLYRCDPLGDALPIAIDTVLRGRPYLSPTANSEYLIAMQSQRRDWKLDSEARAVLRLLAQGATIGKIASDLKIKPRRVYWVREKLRNRFGATTNEHLMARAVEHGFCVFTD